MAKRRKHKIRQIGPSECPSGEKRLHFEVESVSEDAFEKMLDSDPNLKDPIKAKGELFEASDSKFNRNRCTQRKGSDPLFQEYSLDLHGMTLEEAFHKIDATIKPLICKHKSRFDVKIITGRGLHSGPEGSVLARETHHYVACKYQTYILRIDENPMDRAINGIPLKGYFRVSIKR